jgi:hypothetical protein
MKDFSPEQFKLFYSLKKEFGKDLDRTVNTVDKMKDFSPENVEMFWSLIREFGKNLGGDVIITVNRIKNGWITLEQAREYLREILAK